MKISFGSGHDQASLVSSSTLNASGVAPCPSLRSGDEDSSGMSVGMLQRRRPNIMPRRRRKHRNESATGSVFACYSPHMDRCISRYLVPITRFVSGAS